VVKPYADKRIHENVFIRTFENNVDSSELVWHRDAKDRNIKVMEGESWKLQFDNALPKQMKVNENYFIPANTYHRVIKGSSNLILEVKEKV
tara:strand:- start:1765 stop:2037 length:273 start_codon:yes stop_codon:yes gene_type:complete